jgi:hypothetical protein
LFLVSVDAGGRLVAFALSRLDGFGV